MEGGLDGVSIGLDKVLTKYPMRRYGVLLGLIVLGALALRLWGINFGLPYAYHIDERSYVVGALNLGQGEINGYPQQVGLVNVLLGEYVAYFLVGRLVGLFASAQDFARAYYADPTVFYLLGRLTSAVLGVVSCWAVYLLGKELRNRLVGLMAALLWRSTSCTCASRTSPPPTWRRRWASPWSSCSA